MAQDQKNNELNALISLLDEPNDEMFDQIRNQLMNYGNDAIPLLEDAWDNSFDNIIQTRIEDIIHTIQLKELSIAISHWAGSNSFDLLRGFYLITKYQYPDLDEQDIIYRVELIKRDISLELNSNLTALEKVKVINHIIFEIHGYKGNKTNIDAPQNLFINSLLESKKGNHLSIGILYIIIAQKLGIPIFGVNLPQHFILAYVDETHEEKYKIVDENEVLFYINPFNKGAVFTQREIDVFIKHMRIEPNDAYFKPCDNTTIMKRLFETLIYSYKKLGYESKVMELNMLIRALR